MPFENRIMCRCFGLPSIAAYVWRRMCGALLDLRAPPAARHPSTAIRPPHTAIPAATPLPPPPPLPLHPSSPLKTKVS